MPAAYQGYRGDFVKARSTIKRLYERGWGFQEIADHVNASAKLMVIGSELTGRMVKYILHREGALPIARRRRRRAA